MIWLGSENVAEHEGRTLTSGRKILGDRECKYQMDLYWLSGISVVGTALSKTLQRRYSVATLDDQFVLAPVS